MTTETPIPAPAPTPTPPIQHPTQSPVLDVAPKPPTPAPDPAPVVPEGPQYQFISTSRWVSKIELEMMASWYEYMPDVDGDMFEFVQKKVNIDIEEEIIAPIFREALTPAVDPAAQAAATAVSTTGIAK